MTKNTPPTNGATTAPGRRHAIASAASSSCSTQPAPRGIDLAYLAIKSVLHQPVIKLQANRHATIRVDQTSNAIDQAKMGASRLTEKEIDAAMAATRAAVKDITSNKGTRAQWVCLCSALIVACAIESGGVVRGLAAHLEEIKAILEKIGTQAGEDEQPPTWRPPQLQPIEMRAMHTLLDLHTYQIKQLSFSEYQAAYRLAIARVQTSKGEVLPACFVMIDVE